MSVPENGLFSSRRWTLMPDRLTREGRDLFWGWNPDHHILLGDIRMVYVYMRARPAFLLWGILSVPFFLLAWYSARDHGGEMIAAVSGSLGFGIALAAAVLGFIRRPHATIQTARETVAIAMDSPFWAPDRRRRFFNGLAQILGIPDLLPGGGVPRPQAPTPGAPPQAPKPGPQPAPFDPSALPAAPPPPPPAPEVPASPDAVPPPPPPATP